MGAVELVVVGVVVLLAAGFLLQSVRPRPQRPAPKWCEHEAIKSTIAIIIVIGFISGLAMLVSGLADLA